MTEKNLVELVTNDDNVKRFPNYKKFEFKGIDQIDQTDRSKSVADNLREHLEREYNIAILMTEMQMWKVRTMRMQTQIQRYFNSTPFRNAFARFVCYAYMVNIPYSIKSLSDEMHVDRKTISQTVQECEAEGWLEVDRSSGTTYFMGTLKLHEACLDWLKYRKKFAKGTVGRCWDALQNFDKLMSNHEK